MKTLKEKIDQLEDDFNINNSRSIFITVRYLESKPSKQLNAKDKLDEVLRCREEHYKVNLNTKFP